MIEKGRKMTSNTYCYSCKKYGKCCEYANMYGNCLSTACTKVTLIMPEISPVLTNYRIVHRKDGVYDLYDSLRWIMSRGCIDDILKFLSTTSNYSAIRIVFEDQSFEEDCDEKTSQIGSQPNH